MNYQKLFHKLSYLQYPFLILGLAAIVQPYILDFESNSKNLSVIVNAINNMLIFTGIGVSFSTLQDTTTTQNELSKKVWEDSKKSRRFLILLLLTIGLLFSFGIFAYFFSFNKHLEVLGVGTLVLSIGLIGVLKAAIEMANYHQKN